MSTSYGRFARNANRTIGLLRLYRAMEKIPEEHNLPSGEVLRSAVVLSVSAMDAYFTARFCEILVPYLKKHEPGDRLIKLLSRAGLDARQAIIIATMQRPFRRIRTLVQSHLDRYTTQRFSAIDDLFECYGLQGFSGHVFARIKKPRWQRSVEKLVERRHEIVHEGDLNSHGKLRPIDIRSTANRIGHLTRFVEGAEILIIDSLKM